MSKKKKPTFNIWNGCGGLILILVGICVALNHIILTIILSIVAFVLIFIGIYYEIDKKYRLLSLLIFSITLISFFIVIIPFKENNNIHPVNTAQLKDTLIVKNDSIHPIPKEIKNPNVKKEKIEKSSYLSYNIEPIQFQTGKAIIIGIELKNVQDKPFNHVQHVFRTHHDSINDADVIWAKGVIERHKKEGYVIPAHSSRVAIFSLNPEPLSIVDSIYLAIHELIMLVNIAFYDPANNFHLISFCHFVNCLKNEFRPYPKYNYEQIQANK